MAEEKLTRQMKRILYAERENFKFKLLQIIMCAVVVLGVYVYYLRSTVNKYDTYNYIGFTKILNIVFAISIVCIYLFVYFGQYYFTLQNVNKYKLVQVYNPQKVVYLNTLSTLTIDAAGERHEGVVCSKCIKKYTENNYTNVYYIDIFVGKKTLRRTIFL